MEPSAAENELGSTPEPTIVQPPGTTPQAAYPSRDPQQEEPPRIGEDAQFSEELEDRGLLESSTRLKPHEAQNYRKKALWVSWASIVVTLALAVAAFKIEKIVSWCDRGKLDATAAYVLVLICSDGLLLKVGVSSQGGLLESGQMGFANLSIYYVE
ncbi:hypothetical protein lerEdw1_003253 [Lerista edwardsae]|nr:hypothetical protein lerEdw1_003253 [Lerista edwardsae]